MKSCMKKKILIAIVCVLCIAGCVAVGLSYSSQGLTPESGGNSTSTPTNSPTATETSSAVPTTTSTTILTSVPTQSSGSGASETSTPTVTSTVSPTETTTASPTATSTVSPTATQTSSSGSSGTPTPTVEPTQTVEEPDKIVGTWTGSYDPQIPFITAVATFNVVFNADNTAVSSGNINAPMAGYDNKAFSDIELTWSNLGNNQYEGVYGDKSITFVMDETGSTLMMTINPYVMGLSSNSLLDMNMEVELRKV